MIAFLAGYAIAQTATDSSIALNTASSPSSSAAWPVVPIFLPIDVPEHLGASVVTAVSPRSLLPKSEVDI